MIKTQLTREDALRIMELGRALHAESRFKDEPFDDEKCWAVLDSTVRHPDKRFIAYDSEFRGFIIMSMNEEFFNHVKWAADLSLYVAPEFRGSSLVIRLLDSAEKWAKENGARDITIFHNTGIDTDKAPKLFNKLGFHMKGYIFAKELA
jgi:GNAT superfamily N-acetyltransferase